MWLLKSSVGKKVIMSVSGVALVLFLLFHMSMNLVALFNGDDYNKICKFLGANWYALVATAGLAALVVVHFVYAFKLTMQNRKARGEQRYAYTKQPKEVEWASQNMFVLGLVVLVGLGIHLYNFWANMQLVEVLHMLGANVDDSLATKGAHFIKETFSTKTVSGIVYVIVYLVWLVALWFHLTHGFWSAMQTLGWNNQVWFNRWRCIGNIVSSVIILGFAAVVLVYAFCPCAGGC